MKTEASTYVALTAAAETLQRLATPFALVGGLAVSVRAEVRFTRDVDIAIAIEDDAAVERLVRELRAARYEVVTLLEQDETGRIATIRMMAPSNLMVDLLAASSGIEPEIVSRAQPVWFDGVSIPVACAEELLAMKLLSMTNKRLKDRMDAMSLLACNPELDLQRVRDNLALIEARGYHRDQDLVAKMASLQA